MAFATKTVQIQFRIEKVASIYVVGQDLREKPLKNGSKLKRLLRFAWSDRICYKNHSETDPNWRGCSDLYGLVGFHRETIQKGVKIEKGCFDFRDLV